MVRLSFVSVLAPLSRDIQVMGDVLWYYSILKSAGSTMIRRGTIRMSVIRSRIDIIMTKVSEDIFSASYYTMINSIFQIQTFSHAEASVASLVLD